MTVLYMVEPPYPCRTKNKLDSLIPGCLVSDWCNGLDYCKSLLNVEIVEYIRTKTWLECLLRMIQTAVGYWRMIVLIKAYDFSAKNKPVDFHICICMSYFEIARYAIMCIFNKSRPDTDPHQYYNTICDIAKSHTYTYRESNVKRQMNNCCFTAASWNCL